MGIYRGICALAAVVLSATTIFAQETTPAAGNAETSTSKRWGIIDFSVSFLRQSADYESPLETQELMGTVVEIVGENGYWLQVSTPQPYTAWCTNMGVHEVDENGVEDWISARRYIVTVPHSTALMGFRLQDNFRFPYQATSLTEFWHRWHISLSTWFRDYVYIPLGDICSSITHVPSNVALRKSNHVRQTTWNVTKTATKRRHPRGW